MFDAVLAFTNEHFETIAWSASVAVFAIGIILAISYAIIVKDSDYVFGLELEPIGRTIFLIAISFVIAGITWHIWYIIVPLILIGVIAWCIRLYMDHRIYKKARAQYWS